MDHGLDPLALLHLEDIDDVGALGGLAGLGDLVTLLPVDLAGVGEEEDIVVGGGGEHFGHGVLLPGGDALLAHAALGLGGVLAGRCPLDVARLGQGEDTLLLLDQVLDVDLILHILDLRDPVIAEFVGDGLELLLQHLAQQLVRGEQLVEVGDLSSSSLYSASSFSRFRPWRAMSRISQMAWAWMSSRPKRAIRFSLALS